MTSQKTVWTKKIILINVLCYILFLPVHVVLSNIEEIMMIAGNSVVFSTLVCIIFLCILFIFGKTNTIQKLKLSQAFSYGHVFQVPAESMEPFYLRNQEQWELNVWKWTYYLDVGISYKNQHSLTAEGQNTSKIKFGCCSRIVLLLSSYMTTYSWYHYYALYFCYILTKSISYQMIQAIF